MGLRSLLARRFWDATHRRGLPTTWLDDRHVRRHVNRRITGSPEALRIAGLREPEHEAWIDRWVAEGDAMLARGEPTFYLAAVYQR